MTRLQPPEPSFSARLIDWQRRSGRHHLPWQQQTDPYRIWLSEIMLQQTQVATVIPYYTRFLARYPSVTNLAAAPIEDVLSLWSGLGYYARARNLHRCAQVVTHDYAGAFPTDPDTLAQLPGIGRTTAAAIAVFSTGARAAILDGNVKRVLTRHYAIAGVPTQKTVENQLWALAESLLPKTELAVYTQALMDLGATLCTRTQPRCIDCPLRQTCQAHARGHATAFPTRALKAKLPEKSRHFWVLKYGQSVWLERRPTKGIWGGLWSLPEFDSSPTLDDARLQPYGNIVSITALAPFRHSFTHFHLQIQPSLIHLEQAACNEQPDQGRWWPLTDALQIGIPKPVRQILANLLA
ncbi:A/G-specific adenine glycosylase [Parvibium lacunae]|uniref:Adenine DNA glycosylase n=1 Tax=Parvibium lacunae TaxID=1888893 RepID=A0A368KYM8_9BURK|nr:A/G-specific adenine glycosylase [Parvibium lacunae]RCS56523.1 A/G-specific adenine glycosylase [Parvibium lacunae]